MVERLFQFKSIEIEVRSGVQPWVGLAAVVHHRRKPMMHYRGSPLGCTIQQDPDRDPASRTSAGAGC